MAKTPPPRAPQRSSRGQSRWSRLMPFGAGAVIFVGIVAVAVSVGGEAPTTATTHMRDPEVVARGAELFATNCAVCHGPDLRGTATGPPFLDVIYAPNHHSDEAFQQAAAFGVVPHHWNFGPMVPVAGLNREDVAMIVAFVRTEQEAAGIFRDPSHG